MTDNEMSVSMASEAPDRELDAALIVTQTVNDHARTLHKFEVVDVGRSSIAGDKLFTVIHTFDGVVMGGDHHWVRERFADRAKALYEIHPEMHGDPSSKLGQRYYDEFGAFMFDMDSHDPVPEYPTAI